MTAAFPSGPFRKSDLKSAQVDKHGYEEVEFALRALDKALPLGSDGAAVPLDDVDESFKAFWEAYLVSRARCDPRKLP